MANSRGNTYRFVFYLCLLDRARAHVRRHRRSHTNLPRRKNNKPSRRHVTLSTYESAFWEGISIDTIATVDLPTQVGVGLFCGRPPPPRCAHTHNPHTPLLSQHPKNRLTLCSR